MIRPHEDGITHINIYSKGKTELGKLLTNFAHTPVKLPEGLFQSLEGYWYWLLSKQDEDAEALKQQFGFRAKHLGRQLKIEDWPSKVRQNDFKIKFKKAMELKIQQHPKIAEMLKQSTLPFEHYYSYGGGWGVPPKVVTVKGADWIIQHWNKIRQDLQNDE